jgi:hypothetical protein
VHPFAALKLPCAAGGVTLRSSAARLVPLVADHVVQGRTIFPGAGYLEMARAAACATFAASATGATLSGVFFLQPLATEVIGLHVECTFAGSQFEVQGGVLAAGEGTLEDDAAMHCSGTSTPEIDDDWCLFERVSMRTKLRVYASDVGTLYDGFDAAGLQYGPSYRTLVQAWAGSATAAARLRARAMWQGTRVHPADLDDALCAGALASAAQSSGRTRLPFAVEDARLDDASGGLWAVVTLQGAEAMAVQLGTRLGHMQAQLDGFRSRAMRAAPPTQRHLYVTAWRALVVEETSGTAVLALIDDELEVPGCKRISSRVGGEVLAAKMRAGEWAAVAAAVATQRGCVARLPLFALEVALEIVKV